IDKIVKDKLQGTTPGRPAEHELRHINMSQIRLRISNATEDSDVSVPTMLPPTPDPTLPTDWAMPPKDGAKDPPPLCGTPPGEISPAAPIPSPSLPDIDRPEDLRLPPCPKPHEEGPRPSFSSGPF
ncbi:unnamed protein product, partial [Ectocarpus sp. 12 AP-2014]